MRESIAILLSLVGVLTTLPIGHTEPNGTRRYSRIEGADGVPLNVVEVGDASKPTIVLVHGIGQSHSSFDAQLDDPALTGAFHLVSYDLRGHGQSGKPWQRDAYVVSEKWAEDLARVIAATHAVKPVVLGWSYGSLVVADYLRKYGTRDLAGITLVGAYGGLTDPPTSKEPPAPTLIADMNRMLEDQMSGDPAVRAAAVRRGVLRLTAKPMPEAWLAQADTMGLLTATEARRYMFARSLDNKSLVANIDVPFLVFIGGKDGSTPETQGRELVARVPGARSSSFPNAGHSPFAEEPERFNRELKTFADAAFARLGQSKP
jgi:dienelactone hydrolase